MTHDPALVEAMAQHIWSRDRERGYMNAPERLDQLKGTHADDIRTDARALLALVAEHGGLSAEDAGWLCVCDACSGHYLGSERLPACPACASTRADWYRACRSCGGTGADRLASLGAGAAPIRPESANAPDCVTCANNHLECRDAPIECVGYAPPPPAQAGTTLDDVDPGSVSCSTCRFACPCADCDPVDHDHWEPPGAETKPATAEGTEPPGHMVAGDVLPTSIDEFMRRADALLVEEQAKPLPDNAWIGFVCDAVRLARENETAYKRGRDAERAATRAAEERAVELRGMLNRCDDERAAAEAERDSLKAAEARGIADYLALQDDRDRECVKRQASEADAAQLRGWIERAAEYLDKYPGVIPTTTLRAILTGAGRSTETKEEP